MNVFYSLLSFILFSALCSSCNVINPTEQIPTYIRIDSFRFAGDSSLGTAAQKITSVRVNYENQTVGTFDLPALVPVLMDKRGVIALTPGVMYDGLQDVQISYPFFRTVTDTLEPAPGQTITMMPTTRYYGTDVFTPIIVDFEGNYNPFLSLSGDTTFGLDNADAFEGDACLKMRLNSSEEMEIILQKDFSSTPTGFVELHYKNSVPFAVGLQSTDGSTLFIEYFIGIKPQEGWNKIYISLSDFIFQHPLKTYRLVLKAMPETNAGGYVSIDNVKILCGL